MVLALMRSRVCLFSSPKVSLGRGEGQNVQEKALKREFSCMLLLFTDLFQENVFLLCRVVSKSGIFKNFCGDI